MTQHSHSAQMAFRSAIFANWYGKLVCDSPVSLLCLHHQQKHIREVGRLMLLNATLCYSGVPTIDDVKRLYIENTHMIIELHTSILARFVRTTSVSHNLHDKEYDLFCIADQASKIGEIELAAQALATMRSEANNNDNIKLSLHQHVVGRILYKSSVLAYELQKPIAERALLKLEIVHVICHNVHNRMPFTLQRVYETTRDTEDVCKLSSALTDHKNAVQDMNGFYNIYNAAQVAFLFSDRIIANKLLHCMVQTNCDARAVNTARYAAATLALQFAECKLVRQLLYSMINNQVRSGHELRRLGDASVWAYSKGYCDVAREMMQAYKDYAMGCDHLCALFQADMVFRKDCAGNTLTSEFIQEFCT